MALVYLHKVNPILLDEETKYPDELTTPSDSPFMLAMLQNVGNVVKDIGKSAAQEVLLFSLKHAESIQNEKKEVY